MAADLKKFIYNVEQMRVAQRHHNKLITKAKKSKERADWAEAGVANKAVRDYESKVDGALPEMSKITVIE